MNCSTSPRLRSPQRWRLRHEVQELARCVDLIIERAVRELLEFALVRLAPGRTLGQPDSAAVDHVDVVKKSRGPKSFIDVATPLHCLVPDSAPDAEKLGAREARAECMMGV
jgi:hypothetical protein